MTEIQLGSRTFTLDDQRNFAEETGDWNPMHVDPVAARRLLSGEPIVHGIHTLLHALQVWQNRRGAHPSAVVCSFVNAVNVGDAVEFSQTDEDAHRSVVTARVDGLTCATIVVEFEEGKTAIAGAFNGKIESVKWLDRLSQPLEPAAGEQLGQSIGIRWETERVCSMFPAVTARFGRALVIGLARSSALVGMVCPGLHSVYSSLRLSVGDGSSEESWFEVAKFDSRFGLYVVRLHGAVRGEIKAFLRPPPQPQPSMSEVSAVVHPSEFAGVRALLVGGSRGLGELSAKILVAGGGTAHITYATGRDDALSVAAELNRHRPGSCSAMNLDLRAIDFSTLELNPNQFDLVCYFATPRIFRRRSSAFDVRIFNEFVSFYVTRFHELCRWGESESRRNPLRVFVPSTVFIDERPKGMTEYAMAKAAAEVLASDLNATLKNVRVFSTRLPRMLTDQTASLLKLQTDPALDTLLPLLRDLLR